MNALVCPHCKSHRIVTSKVPRDVVVVMPCPACGELTVLFRDRAIALDRKIIEHGSNEERVTHFATVITEFLESGILPFDEVHFEGAFEQSRPMPPRKRAPRARKRPPSPPAMDDHLFEPSISQEEIDRFIAHELKQLDDPVYFKRHFG
jgi:hypothetical protein